MNTQEIIDAALRRFPSEASAVLNRRAAETVRELCDKHGVSDFNDVRAVMREAKAVFEPLIERTVRTLELTEKVGA